MTSLNRDTDYIYRHDDIHSEKLMKRIYNGYYNNYQNGSIHYGDAYNMRSVFNYSITPSSKYITNLPTIVNPFQLISNGQYRDRFQTGIFYLSNTRVRAVVRRIDESNGWGQHIKLKIFSEDRKKNVEIFFRNKIDLVTK
jgi:ABC-type antimicrobial peptide transport system permease subunit